MKLRWNLVKGCVTGNSNVPLICKFVNMYYSSGVSTGRVRSGRPIVPLSPDKAIFLSFCSGTPGTNLCTSANLSKYALSPLFFVCNPKKFSREVRLSLHQMSRTLTDWWMTLANRGSLSVSLFWFTNDIEVVKSGEQGQGNEVF